MILSGFARKGKGKKIEPDKFRIRVGKDEVRVIGLLERVFSDGEFGYIRNHRPGDRGGGVRLSQGVPVAEGSNCGTVVF